MKSKLWHGMKQKGRAKEQTEEKKAPSEQSMMVKSRKYITKN